VGYYDGDTRIVMTNDFNPWQAAKERMTSNNMVLTGRFNRVADGKIHYSFTIDDSDLYTQL